jgi:prevent-host-death family protein
MQTASIADFKARLSAFLDVVKEGQEVIITERGRPIAQVTAVRGSRHDAAHRDQLIRSNQMKPPAQGLPKDLLTRSLPADVEGHVMTSLLDERNEGR